MLTVEGILALHHTGMGAVAQVLAGGLQRGGNLKIRHRRELDGGVFQRGVLKSDGPGGNHHVPGKHLHVDAAAGAHPDKGVRAQIVQLLHGDGSRGAADAGGADRHLFPQHRAGVDVELPVHADVHRVIKVRRDCLASARVTGQKYVPSHIALLAVNVKLHSDILHNSSSFPDSLLQS